MLMEKFIPFEKLSKKKQKALNAARRGSWGGIDPVTRKPPDPKAYNRQKEKARTRSQTDRDTVPSFFSDQYLLCTFSANISMSRICSSVPSSSTATPFSLPKT